MRTKTVVVKTKMLPSTVGKAYREQMAAYDAACKETKGIFAKKPDKPRRPAAAAMLDTEVDEVDLQIQMDKVIAGLAEDGYVLASVTPIQSAIVHVQGIKSDYEAVRGAFNVSGDASFAIPYTSAIVIVANKL